MSTNFSIIGGDLRIIKLAKMLAEDGNNVYTYGMEKAEELKENKNIIMCNKLQETVKKSEIVIGYSFIVVSALSACTVTVTDGLAALVNQNHLCTLTKWSLRGHDTVPFSTKRTVEDQPPGLSTLQLF